MQLDRKASEIVLRSLRDAIPTRWPAKVQELRSLLRDRGGLGLTEFLEHSGLDLEDVYDGGRSWSDLREAAGAPYLPRGPKETALRRAIGRLLHVDDALRTDAILRFASDSETPNVESLPERDRRLLHMFIASLADQVVTTSTSLDDAVSLVWEHPQILTEVAELATVLGSRIGHVHAPLVTHPDSPLQVHARYSRIEILTALGLVSGARAFSWQAGVFDAKPADADLLTFTLDKTTGGFSPTTRYRDYAISPSLIHWESQASTRATSATGLRYQHHERLGRAILLFARLRTTDRAFWFLGPATYRGHVGERPMAITWELHTPLPGDLYQAFGAAVA